jgi:peptidoglycan/LPS O-acetylase OafA/YrhL
MEMNAQMIPNQSSAAPQAPEYELKRNGSFLPGIEACRGIAALMVLFFHSSARLVDRQYFDFQSPALERWMRFGPTGVDLFFVISGFIIFYAHRNDIGNRKAVFPYFLRRILRIYPVYWAILFSMLVLYFIFPSAGEAYQRDFYIIFKSIFLLPDPLPPINNAAWTLRHEVLFYCLFSFFIFYPFWGRCIMVLWFFCLLAATVFELKFPASFFFYIKNIEFLLGVAAALFCSSISNRLAPWVVTVGTFLFLSVGIGRDVFPWLGEEPVQTVSLGIGSALIIGGLARMKYLNVPKILLYFGKISYPLYIIQPLSIPILCSLLFRLNAFISFSEWAVFISLVVGTIASAYFLHKCIEVPVLNYTRRRRHKWQSLPLQVKSIEGNEGLR